MALEVQQRLCCMLPEAATAVLLAALAGVISTSEGSDDEALRKLFMRIDANCDATVDWWVATGIARCLLVAAPAAGLLLLQCGRLC
jgi:hypothetical protein